MNQDKYQKIWNDMGRECDKQRRCFSRFLPIPIFDIKMMIARTMGMEWPHDNK